MKDSYEKVIRPRTGLLHLNLGELWEYRELFWVLAMRTILVRYKQTVVGVLWAMIQPLLTMVIFTIVFGRLAGFGSTEEHYPLVVFAGVLPWQLFANSLTQSTDSLVSGSAMISKVYFPRLIMPTSACLVGLIDFCLAFLILIGLMVFYGVMPSWQFLLLPGFLLLAICASLGVGLWLSALNVRYRDVRHVVPFVVQLGLYVSPVGFTTTRIPKEWQFLYAMNPMVSVIDGFRWALLERGQFHVDTFVLSAVIALFLFISGAFFFRWMERSFADYV
ncbi:MAG: ABC transporter permease [Pseudomonadota bacterium]